MKFFYQTTVLLAFSILLFFQCDSKEEDPLAQFNCDTFEEGRNAILDAEEKELKCAFSKVNYFLYKDSFEADAEEISFEFDREFYVTYSTSESYRDEQGTLINESNGTFQEGMSYEADARTGNATFFSPATLEITKLDRELKLISGKITSQAPIRWEAGTPIMGYAIYIFTDLKM